MLRPMLYSYRSLYSGTCLSEPPKICILVPACRDGLNGSALLLYRQCDLLAIMCHLKCLACCEADSYKIILLTGVIELSN